MKRAPHIIVIEPSASDLAYAAGIIDGEGCIHIGFASHSGRRMYRPIVEVSNTRIELLYWLRDRFGGSIPPTPRRNPTSRSKPIYRWMLPGIQPVADCLRAVTPYLLLKKRQAQLAIEFAETRTHGGKPISVNAQTKRQAIGDEMKILNRRGVELVA